MSSMKIALSSVTTAVSALKGEYPDGALAVYWGPHRLGDYDAAGALVIPASGVALAGGSIVT
jgi:hypothetical protein